MFIPEERVRLRSELLEYAATDKRISGAAITGSAANEREDRWSNIDLAFGVNDIGLGWLYALRARSCLARVTKSNN